MASQVFTHRLERSRAGELFDLSSDLIAVRFALEPRDRPVELQRNSGRCDVLPGDVPHRLIPLPKRWKRLARSDHGERLLAGAIGQTIAIDSAGRKIQFTDRRWLGVEVRLAIVVARRAELNLAIGVEGDQVAVERFPEPDRGADIVPFA